MDVIKRLIFINLLIFSPMLMEGETLSNSQSASLDQIQSEINQLKEKLPLKAEADSSSNTQESMIPDITTNPLIGSLLSTSGAVYTREQRLLKSMHDDKVKVKQYYIGGRLEQKISYYSKQPDGYSQTNLYFKPKLGFLTRLTSWLSGFSSIESTSSNLNVTAGDNYFLINPQTSPFYMILGRKYIDFGYFKRASDKISPLNRVFWISSPQAQAELGYYSKGVNAQLTAFNGSSTTNTNTNQISNYAGTIYYHFNLTDTVALQLGSAYLNGLPSTARLPNSTTVILNDDSRTSAVDFFGVSTIKLGKDLLTYSGEYTQSIQMDNNRTVSGWLIASEYQTNCFKRIMKFFLNYSGLNALSGHNNQYLIGLETTLYGASVGIDYALLTDSSSPNDHLIEAKFEYIF